MKKIRLDALLLEQGLFETRSRAQAAIMAGQILVNDQKVDKPGTPVTADARIKIIGNKLPYVSRGGLKL
ncbi:MAG: S4 domain-containing protein, partial [Acidaminococcaceae bacterium]